MKRIRSGEDYVQENIGVWWPGNWREAKYLKHYPNLTPTVEGIKSMAKVFNFGLEMPDDINAGGDPQASARILKTRNVRGLILLPGNPQVYNVPEHLNDFTLVGIGNAVQGPLRRRVALHFEDAYFQTFEQLAKRGYQRPGIILRAERDPKYEMRFLGAHEHYCHRKGSFTYFPPFDVGGAELNCSKKQFQTWLKKNKPDVIYSPYISVYQYLTDNLGVSIPEDMGYVNSMTDPRMPEISGPSGPMQHLGSEAVAALHNELMNPIKTGEAIQTRIFLKTRWQEGATLPPRQYRS